MTDDTSPFYLQNLIGLIGKILAFGIALMALYTAGFGALPPDLHRTFALVISAFVLMATKFGLSHQLRPNSQAARALCWLVDFGLIGVLGFASYWFHKIKFLIDDEFYTPNTFDILIALAAIGAVLEIGRRVWGLPLFIVTTLFLSYYLFGHLLPVSVGHFEYSWSQSAETLWYSYAGVFSTIMSIVLNLVFVFIVFGILLETTGAGEALLNISLALTGRTRGGPAHGAIVASGFFGMMSGSTIANVVGTGTFTIPMIKKRGFKPEFAGGIEATASSGGQIVPPIMGAAAFVMADLVNIPYLMIALAALVPAGLYYLNLFLSVSIEARKQGIEPLSAAELPKISRTDVIRSLSFIIPILVVIATLVSGRSASLAGFFAAVSVVITGALNPNFRARPLIIIQGLVRGGINAASVLIAVAMIGLIIATMNSTGAGLKFAAYIEYLGQGQLFLSLVLAMLGALILGMGMPTLPAYLVIVLILGPAIEQMGLSLLTIHMFVFYYGVASSITPPVALAAYAAAPIAQSDPLKTGIMAVRLGAAKFLVPFVFAYNPTLLLIETFDPVTFALALCRTVLAFWLFATIMAGFHRTSLSWTEISLRFVACVLLLLVYPIAQSVGGILGIALIVFHIRNVHAKTLETGTERN